MTLPLLGPGLLAAAALVFLSTATELTATLILSPTGTMTLATGFWSYTTGLSYGAAAPYAALMVGLSAIPAVVLVPLSRSGPGGLGDVSEDPDRRGLEKSFGRHRVLSGVDADGRPTTRSPRCSARRAAARRRSCA